MKEAYFTPATLPGKAQAMYRELEEHGQKRAKRFSPQDSALLVLDMQDYFLQASSHAYVPSSAAILPGLQALIQAYAGGGLPVVFTRHVNTQADAGCMGTWWHDLITDVNPLSAISAQLNLAAGSMLQKSQYDAFFNTTLEEDLRRQSVSQVVVGGVMTHLCCETTARSAFMRGFEVFFLVDGTATYHEAFHRAALTNLAHGFAALVLIEHILYALKVMDES